MNLTKRIDAFLKLGTALRQISGDQPNLSFENSERLFRLIQNAVYSNPWFTADNVTFALQSIGNSLTEKNMERWLQPYAFHDAATPKTIGVIMAGNIPLVGFHDLLCVLISGHRLLAKTSSGDSSLTATLAKLLIEIEPGFANRIAFSDSLMKNCDAYIATGSNNSALYFEQYFGKYPHIIRQHRNAVAVLQGTETEQQLSALAADVFRYYGLGCRNVSKLFVPKEYDFTKLLQQWESWKTLNDNLKYFHNYTFNKTIYLVNNDPHLDNGFLLLKKDAGFASPISVLFFEEYETLDSVKCVLSDNRDRLQCVVSECANLETAITFGKAQQPNLWDYADGVDVLNFLLNL